MSARQIAAAHSCDISAPKADTKQKHLQEMRSIIPASAFHYGVELSIFGCFFMVPICTVHYYISQGLNRHAYFGYCASTSLLCSTERT